MWRARIESVVFGKDGDRQVTAMFSTESEARALSAALVTFAQQQSVLVSPGSAEDERRLAALSAGEAALGGTPAALLHHNIQALAALGNEAASQQPAQDQGTNASPQRFCPMCGAGVPAGARFCPSCGAALPTGEDSPPTH